VVPNGDSIASPEALRVLHVGKYFPPEPGGIERFVDDLTREQAHQGLLPAALVHDRNRSDCETLEGRRLYRCRSLGQILFTPIAPGWPRWLARALAEHRPQLLHFHLPNPVAFAALLLPKARRIPWVVHWHADIPRDAHHAGLRLVYPAYAAIERQLLRHSAAVIATSQAYLDASAPLAEWRSRCHVVPLGLGAATPASEHPPWPSTGLRVLAVGRLSYYKGFDRLVSAMAKVEGASLLIAGDGDQAARLRAQIDHLRLADRVVLRSGLSDAEIEACYRACDVVCLPSIDRAEAFGVVLLEAMRAGKPVIASRLAGSGMTEVVVDQQTGLQITPDSVDALSGALSRLRDAAPLRDALGRAGKLRFQSHYRLAPVCAAISNVYRRVQGH
jgi:rhamnosyl/mannosyltransferase